MIQPFAQLRYDEAPIPLVSNWTSGESAFDAPRTTNEEETSPPRCEKCRGYLNPWVRWTDGGRKWGCNLCGASNNGKLIRSGNFCWYIWQFAWQLNSQSSPVPDQYFSHLAPNGQRLDHHDRPELQHGTVDFPVPRSYWAPQPPPTGSLLDTALDSSAANIASASDAIASTASDLLGGLQTSLGQTPTRGPSPAPGYKEREKERKKEERRLRRPLPLGRVFVIDVSAPSVGRGVLREVCEGIRRALFGSKRKTEADGAEAEGEGEEEEEEVIGKGERIAIVTVAETIGFWNLSVSL